MAENITKIKVGDDVRCISLDTEVVDTTTLGRDGSDKLSVKLGSSMDADTYGTGIGVKIHPDTVNYLQREPAGLSLKLDTMAEAMAGAVGDNLGLVIDGYNNTLKLGTKTLTLGTGLTKGDGNELVLSLGSGLEVSDDKKIRLKLDDTQNLIVAPAYGPIRFNLENLYTILEARYNLTKK